MVVAYTRTSSRAMERADSPDYDDGSPHIDQPVADRSGTVLRTPLSRP